MDNPSASSTEEILDQIKDLLGRLSRNDKPLTILDSLEKLLKMLGNLLPKMRERGALFKAQLSSGGAMNLSELKAWAQDLESQLRPKSPSFFGRLIGSIRKEK